MDEFRTIEEFYLTKQCWIPENLKKEIGHFNVFPLEDCYGTNTKPMSYSRKDFYKISLIIGRKRLSYADKIIDIDTQALLFANPQIPYKIEVLDEHQTGIFCIFTEAFFSQYGNLKDYPMFQPNGNPIFHLTEAQVPEVRAIFDKMLVEIASDYVYKYDVIRSLVFELIHKALKMHPISVSIVGNSNASTRISSLFMELLERQFPIESPTQRINFRSPIEFANQLSVHVNHLNRALKEMTGKTTSQVIAERVCQEARMLLKHTNWNISEIAWSLGFEELSNFINFFKKHTLLSPKAYREFEFV